MNLNLNPVANGNKTQNGAMGTISVFLTAGIYAVLKSINIDNTEIAALIVAGIINGSLFLIGLIHKKVKTK